MHPFYFGDTDRPLFGVYHPPGSQAVHDVGVLLCYPGAEEYMSIHWAFRRLAVMLSKSGFHVLRFDYFGTGDSSGEFTEANILQWQADIRAAVAELRDMASTKRISRTRPKPTMINS